MYSKRTLSLSKDLQVPRNIQPTMVYGENIDCCEQLESNSHKSLADYLQELREAKTYILRLHFTTTGDLNILLSNELHLDRLCKILPMPFLLIQCKGKIPSTKRDGVTHEKRLDIARILGNSRIGQWIKLFSLDQKIESCIVDISIGWVEPLTRSVKNAENSMRLNFETLFQSLFEKDASKDLTIITGNGAELRCHRMIFEAHSDVLSAMISPNNGRNERVEMLENSEEGLSHLLQYLYGMELKMDDLSCGVTIELFKTAQKFKLTQLSERLCEYFLRKTSDWFTPDDLSDLYFYVKNLAEFKAIEEYILSIMLHEQEAIKGDQGMRPT